MRTEMPEHGEGGGAPFGDARQATIDALCEHFANDVMTVEEFERRIDVAHRATSLDELNGLLRDLPGGSAPALSDGATGASVAPRYSVTSAANVKERELVVAVLGGSSRKGRWAPARSNLAIAVCGGAELDFREAAMGPGVTDLRVFALWGGVEIIVPPGLNVESHGIALLGGFEQSGDTLHHPDPSAPTLRISGVAVMGGVDVKVRYPGETARDARQRRRLEAREVRQQRRLEAQERRKRLKP